MMVQQKLARAEMIYVQNVDYCLDHQDFEPFWPKSLPWGNILPQTRLIVLVWPSFPPETAHRFIFECFQPILPQKQLI